VKFLDRFAGIEFSFVEGFSKSSRFLSRLRYGETDATTRRRVLSRGKYGDTETAESTPTATATARSRLTTTPIVRIRRRLSRQQIAERMNERTGVERSPAHGSRYGAVIV
jgi:hypothetical protein